MLPVTLRPRRPSRSQLECLPTELLEDIFVFSLNVNLARASPVLQRKLHSDVVKRRLALAAFHPAWKYEEERAQIPYDVCQAQVGGIWPT